MPIIAKSDGGTKFEPINEGVHMANCVGIIDLGTHFSEKFNKKSQKVLIQWELPEETIEIDGEQKPRFISKEYTLSLGEKATLRKDLEAWRGKTFTETELNGFDLKNVLGKPCQIQIIHKESNGKIYGNIAAIMSVPKGYKASTPASALVYFSTNEDGCMNEFANIPTWIQEKIKQSEEWAWLQKNIPVEVADTEGEEDSGLPF